MYNLIGYSDNYSKTSGSLYQYYKDDPNDNIADSHNKKFCLSLHYNGVNSYLFVNGTKIHKFKANDSDIVATPLCLGNISKTGRLIIWKNTGLNGYVYEFSVKYNATAVDDMLDIPKYLMKKIEFKMVGFVKQIFYFSNDVFFFIVLH